MKLPRDSIRARLIGLAMMLTGMALTLAVVYRPQWVATFDDARYLAQF